MTKHLIAIDPGGTTGIAIYDPLINLIGTVAINIGNVLFFVDEAHKSYAFDGIAIEPFRTAGRLSSYGLETIDLVGQLKGWAYCNKVPVTLYPPQSRRAWMEKDEPTPHQQDAKAHLKHFMQNQGIKIALV